MPLDSPSHGKQPIFEIQTEILRVMVDELVKRGFRWILPVMLAKSTDPLWPDPGSSIEKRIEVDIYGEKVRTMHSMILHKRVLASLGPEKFFILSPNIRIEKRDRAKTGCHLYEFTQLDLEIAHGKMEDVLRLFEDLIRISITSIKDRMRSQLLSIARDVAVPETPFRVHTRSELADKYGEDWEGSLSKDLVNPVWVTDLPREFYDYEDQRTGSWRNFDLILPEGYGEVISGAEREHEYQRMSEKLERDGLKKEEYALLLRLAKEGRLKPSAGAGLGVERFVAYVCGAKHVAEVQPFPRIPGVVPEL
jgi:asparaginyl-tRNA synthetase